MEDFKVIGIYKEGTTLYIDAAFRAKQPPLNYILTQVAPANKGECNERKSLETFSREEDSEKKV